MNLQKDHIKPPPLGGETNEENLRLLCFHCNQRAAIRVFAAQLQRTKKLLKIFQESRTDTQEVCQ
jgi:5-methylcytosine-specific restriction endonuclease McrA